MIRSIGIITLIVLLGAGLRFHALVQDARFHPDEAFFATFARNAAVHGDWWLQGALDKTPLTIYATAVSMHLTAAYITNDDIIEVTPRQGEFAARWPNALAGILLIALVYALMRRIIPAKRQSAYLAALLAALSPYLVAFSATAFTDMLMLVLMVAALLAALRGAPVWSGALLALSVAAKQQGVFYLPLVLLFIGWDWCALRRFGVAFVLGVGCLLRWDALRPGTSVFALASVNNNPERLFVTLAEWWPRLTIWLRHASWILGPPIITLLLVVGAVWRFAIWQLYRQSSIHGRVVLLWGYIGMYLLGHWLVAFNTYDRYLLPLAPLLIVAVASVMPKFRPGRAGAMLLTGMFFVMLITALLTAQGGISLGRDGYPRQTEQIALADYLNSQPLGTIIYDYWVGWELDYYSGAWTDKRRVYYPTPQAFQQDAPRNPERAPRYFVVPVGVEASPWLRAMEQAGFTLAVDRDAPTERFTLYRLLKTD